MAIMPTCAPLVRMRRGVILLAVSFIVAAVEAMAATATGTLNVSATVADTCTVSGTDLAFGTLSTTAASVEVTPGVVTVTCTSAKASITVTLDGGLNASGGTRRMSNGAGSTVPYSVYASAGRSSAIAVGGQLYQGAIAAATPTGLNVYGSVVAGNYNAGSYTDTLTVTAVY